MNADVRVIFWSQLLIISFAVKPSQQSGTLPRLHVTKSWLKRDAISASRHLSSQERSILLQILYELLDEEYKLASDSDVYSRTSFATTSAATSAPLPAPTSSTSSRSTSKDSFVTAHDNYESDVATDIATTTMAKKKPEARSKSPKKREGTAASASTAVSVFQPFKIAY